MLREPEALHMVKLEASPRGPTEPRMMNQESVGLGHFGTLDIRGHNNWGSTGHTMLKYYLFQSVNVHYLPLLCTAFNTLYLNQTE